MGTNVEGCRIIAVYGVEFPFGEKVRVQVNAVDGGFKLLAARKLEVRVQSMSHGKDVRTAVMAQDCVERKDGSD